MDVFELKYTLWDSKELCDHSPMSCLLTWGCTLLGLPLVLTLLVDVGECRWIAHWLRWRLPLCCWPNVMSNEGCCTLQAVPGRAILDQLEHVLCNHILAVDALQTGWYCAGRRAPRLQMYLISIPPTDCMELCVTQATCWVVTTLAMSGIIAAAHGLYCTTLLCLLLPAVVCTWGL